MKQAEFDFEAKPQPAAAPEPKAKPASAERKKEIVEKIKKLLRLGQSSHKGEAESAMRRAFELANSYGVDVESLDLDEATEKLAHDYFKCGERLSFLRQRVLGILHFFKVEVCVCGARVLFAGRESDVMIAGYAYEFLVWAGGAALRDYLAGEKAVRRRVTPNKKQGFVEGFIYGVTKQLAQARGQLLLNDERAALVVAEDAVRKKYLDELVPNQELHKRKKAAVNQTALEAGYREGKKTQINQPLTGHAAKRLALE